MTGRLVVLSALAVLGAGCGEGGLGPAAERGRQVYLAQCTACHHPSDPAKPGALGPEIAGVPRAVLEAKVLRGTYPPGYRPKRDSRVMPPLPAVAPDLPALAEFLRAS